MGGQAAFIEIDRVQKTYQTPSGETVHAIEEASLSIHEGEFICIVGPSGCGKSTLLKIVAGLLLPTSGRVLIGGKPVTGPTSDVGMVFQSPVLLKWRKVLDNVLLPVEFLQLDRRRYEATARELLELVGLKGFEDKYPSQLSGGMQQRVAISRALVHDPKILLMDEPFGALDELTRDRMNLELLRIWEARRKTVLFITHSISEALFLADRVVVMTARPARIARVIRVDLPRPRSFDIRTQPVFGEMTMEIYNLLQESQRSATGGER